jgi:hypothetical protein
MNARLTRGEYWILNAVVEARCPLCWLGGPRPSATFNTISGHGLSRGELVETLDELSARGWLSADRCHRNEDRTESHTTPFAPDRESIDAVLDEPSLDRTVRSCVYYGLTAEGGAVWEAFASPDWSRYLDTLGGSCAEDDQSVCGLARWRIEHYLTLLADEGYFIDPASMGWSDRVPWEATYWKTFPVGLEAKYRVLSEPTADERDREKRNAFIARCAFERWYDWR